jgi:hypothetical protein
MRRVVSERLLQHRAFERIEGLSPSAYGHSAVPPAAKDSSGLVVVDHTAVADGDDEDDEFGLLELADDAIVA